MSSTILKITGMHCASCKTLIEEVVGDVPGVRSCAVDPAAGTASIEHDDTLDPAVLVSEIQNLGEYSASVL